jgi:hypothetical protein
MKRSTYLLATLALLVAMSFSQIGCSGYSGVAAAAPAYGGVGYGVAPGAASIAEPIVLAHGVAATATTTMPMAALPRGAAAPARPPGAGAARLRGIMAAEAPTALGEVPLRGVAVLGAPQDSEAALLRGVAAPAPITGLSAVQAPGVVDSRKPRQAE